MRKVVGAILIIFVCLCSTSFAADDLFGEEITQEELAVLKLQARQAQELIDQMDALKLMIMYRNFHMGKCEEVENIEQKAVRGDAKSQYIIGSLYNEGLCVGENKKKAVEMIGKAAEQNYISAQFYLGLFYLQGNGVQENSSEAIKWLERCAEADETRCQIVLSEIYLKGQGVPKSAMRAAGWLEKAAKQNDAHAISKLGVMYATGEHIPQDLNKAENLLKRGAERGQAVNQYLLAILLSDPEMGQPSKREAYKWVNLAANASDEKIASKAIELRAELEKSMPLQEVVEAQELAENWKPVKDVVNVPKRVKLPTIKNVGSLSLGEARWRLKELGIPVSREVFFQSIEEDNFEVFLLFIKAGASLNTKKVNPMGVTPLYWAVDFGSDRIIDYLLNNGADVNRYNSDNGMTPLVRAISHERWALVDQLLDLGASAKQRDESRPEYGGSLLPGTPLAYSLMHNKPDLVKRILKCGGSVDERYVMFRTPLMEAISGGHPENVKIMIQSGANLEDKSITGETALLMALSDEEAINYKIVELLLSAGASTKYPKNKYTPLLKAVIKGDVGVVRLLAKYGYDLNEEYRIPRENMPMNLENEELIDLLGRGGTPIMVATIVGNYSAVKTLAELNVDKSVIVEGENGPYTLKELAEKSSNPMVREFVSKNL